jgi:RHS repeat-associated protein
MGETSKTTVNALKKEIRDPGTAFTVTTHYEQFDAFGNPGKATVSASGVANRVTEYQYDPKGRFATRVTNTLGQHTHYTYDGRWGQPLTVTDITGLTASSQYDAFGRLKSATDALGHTSTTAMVWDVGAHGSAVYRMDNQSPGSPPASTWFDAHNRELRSETEGYNGPVAATKRYDARGRTEEGTMPSPQSTGVPQPIVQTMAYDNLNRLQTVSDGTRTTGSTFGMVGTTYSTTVTDPGGRERTQRVDIHGRVVRTDDPAGHLTFEYDIAGRLKKTTGHTLDGSTVLTEMEYDLLGHQTLLKDVDAGETHYVHNAFGELTSQTDANGQNHTMQYDAMGRITQRTGPDGTTTYQYVTSGNGLNQLRKVTAPNGTMQEYTYDDLSRVSSLKETVDGKVFTTSYTYDNFGRVKDITYPAGLTVSHAYDSHGHLTTVTADGTPIYTLGGKNNLGQVTQYTLGNGVTTTKTINEHGHLTAIEAPLLQHLTMDFDPLTGTMNWRRDNVKGLREDFEHDNLDRLLEAERTDAPLLGPVVPDLNVHYDLQGNIEIKSDVGEYSYDSERVHAVQSITDPDGSISRDEQLISYTPYGRRTATIFEGLHSVEFTYGPDNERKLMVLKEGSEVKATRYYHGNYEEVEIGNDTYLIHYIGGGDGLAAIQVQHIPSSGNTEGETKLYYVYKDHLGSILTLTDEEGDIEHEQSFDAWGRYRDPHTWQVLNSDPSDDELTVDMPPWMTRGYTGHEHLREFDLINMNGRMYDPTIGRMLAPDNYVQDPYNTQSYNRYAYVFNSPLSYTDPSGEIAWWAVALISTAVNYVANAAINGSMNPNEWTGSIAISAGYNGSGFFMTGGGNIGGNFSVMAGGGFNGGYQYGFQAGPGLAGTSQVQPAGTVNINMSAVDWYRPRGQRATLPAFVGRSEEGRLLAAQLGECCLPVEGDGGGPGDGEASFQYTSWSFYKRIGVNFLESSVDKVVYTGTVLPVSLRNGFRYGYNEIILGKRMVLSDSQKWKAWRFSLSAQNYFYQETPYYGSNNTVSREEGAIIMGGTARIVMPPFLTPLPGTISTPASLIFGTGVPYLIDP